MSAHMPFARFRLGQIVATSNALLHLSQQDIDLAIGRHQAGEWGALDEADKTTNESALERGGPLFSRHLSAQNVVFWVITEADRSVTTVLLPEDY